MTTITIDRALLEHALEALEQSETTVPYDGFGMAHREAERKHQAAITALKAALAQEQAEQTWVCPDSPEHRYAKPGHCEDCGKTLVQEQAEPVQEPVAYTTGHCKERAKPGGCQLHNLHCGYPKCDRKSAQEQAEPVQEPVAWLYEAGNDRTLHWNKPPLYGTPLYTAPPKPEPLTDEEIDRITDQQWGAANGQMVLYAAFRAYARAIERALEAKNGR